MTLERHEGVLRMSDARCNALAAFTGPTFQRCAVVASHRREGLWVLRLRPGSTARLWERYDARTLLCSSLRNA